MGTEEDWLYRPVLEGLCHYESLKNGTLDLEDILIMNEIIDVRSENQERYRKATET